jgi:serine protease Do
MALFLTGAFCFGQASSLRDYVGLISIQYHPDVVAYMGKFKEAFEKKGYSNAARAIDNYLRGLSGSGFSHIAPDGTCYVLTNAHVIAQSESLSIAFEKQDGTKTIHNNLKVYMVDEDKDLAILYFDSGARPFTQALSFYAGVADEGDDVYAAGFPGLGNTALWQFSAGKVSNAVARLPKNNDDTETIGPFIQHTAQIDPGNSGGPLLVSVQGVPTGYAVAGINTLSAIRRQAANYAIPIDQISAFINTALSKDPVNEKELIAKKVDDFVKGLQVNKEVYNHISNFLSNACTATNAEYAISELLDKASRTVLEDIDSTFSHDPVMGMNAAVGWLIENLMRSRAGDIKISLDSITQNDKGGFSVSFMVNDRLVRSEWVKEYGIYRMDTYGNMVAGDKSLITEKERRYSPDGGWFWNPVLYTNYGLTVSAGYAYIQEGYGSAFTASLVAGSLVTFGFDVNIALGSAKYNLLDMTTGIYIPINMNSFAVMLFGDVGWGLLFTDPPNAGNTDSLFDFDFDLVLKGGLMFTTAAIPGLFGRLFYAHNITIMSDIPNHGMIGVSVGYGF